jgi:hypothetical protein
MSLSINAIPKHNINILNSSVPGGYLVQRMEVTTCSPIISEKLRNRMNMLKSMREPNMPTGLLLSIPTAEPTSLVINGLCNSAVSSPDFNFVTSNDTIISKL